LIPFSAIPQFTLHGSSKSMLLPRRVIFIFGFLIIEARDTAPHSEFDTLPTATVAVSDVEQAESSIAATAVIKIIIFFIAYIYLCCWCKDES
jgi:hypothetical protein